MRNLTNHKVKVAAALALDDDEWRQCAQAKAANSRAQLALLHAAIEKHGTLPDGVDVAVVEEAIDDLQMAGEPKRAVVAALPLSERVNLAKRADYDLLTIEGTWALREAFAWADLGPSKQARDKAIAALVDGDAPEKPEQVQELVAALKAFFAPFEGVSAALKAAAKNANAEMAEVLRAVAEE